MSRVDVIISLQEIILELGSYCTIQVNVMYNELNNVARLYLRVFFFVLIEKFNFQSFILFTKRIIKHSISS